MARKQYAAADVYERKLARVMERLGVDEFNWNWDRWSCWVQFRYKGELYQFDHSVNKAQAHGVNLRYGSDAFAQVVLALEDLARMVERGIYELSVWVSGMKMLPPAQEVPEFFRAMGFDRIPDGVEEVRARWRALAKQLHPDGGGNPQDFQALKRASEQAVEWFTQQDGEGAV